MNIAGKSNRTWFLFLFFLLLQIYFSPFLWATPLSISVLLSSSEYDIGEPVQLGSTSAISNSSNLPITGTVTLSVEKREGETWVEDATVYQAANQIVYPNGELSLHELWSSSPWMSEATGIYRVVAKFNYGSAYLMDSSTFIVRVMDLNMADKTIVVYNANSADGLEIANYYAVARGLSAYNICPVTLPTGQFASKDELLGARKQIVENCLCNLLAETLPQNQVPSPCSVSNLDAIAAVSPITHMALIRGIPPRLYNTGWPQDEEGPSFDYYLSIMLYGNNHIFDPGQNGVVPSSPYAGGSTPQSPEPAYFYVRPIRAALDRIVAYGRVEAMTKERTFDLIDRTLAAERGGLQGNFFYGMSNGPDYNRTAEIFRNLTADQDPVCFDYLNDPTGIWPHEECRTGLTRGELPGEAGSSIPKAYNSSIYLGTQFEGNGQNAFDGFNNMLNWRKTTETCTPLCRQLGSGLQILDCMNRSTDYFKEMNTDCVGAAPGLMGFQLRSWTVQYYGFWPSGWTHTSGGNGALEKTAPVVLAGNAFINSKFTDDLYLHFGALDANPNSSCVYADGTTHACKEKIAVNLRQLAYPSPKITIQPNHAFTFRFRHRNPATPGALLSIKGYVRFDGDDSNYLKLNQSVDVSAAASTWQEKTFTFTVDDAGRVMNRFFLDIETPLSTAPQGWLELDGFETVEVSTGREILDVETSSFAEPYNDQTSPGDYAANAIDRLGGIAWWGSSSHFMTTGAAFGNTQDFSAVLPAGRTLGESLAYTGGTNAMAGIIYGDPVYRPAAAKMYLASGLDIFNDPARPFVFRESDDSRYKGLKISALQGHDYYLTTNWEISVCEEDNILHCDSAQAWQPFISGTGAGLDREVVPDLMSFISDPYVNKDMILRLKVWNPSRADDALHSYGYLSYKSGYISAYQYAISIAGGRRAQISGDRVIWISDGGSCSGCTQIRMYDFNAPGDTLLVEDVNIQDIAIDGDDVVWINDIWWETNRNHLKHLSLANPSHTVDLDLILNTWPNGLDVSGGKIVFVEKVDTAGTNLDVFMYDLATGVKRQISQDPGAQTQPAIDGNHIAWLDGNVYYYDLTTSTTRQVTADSFFRTSVIVDNGHLAWPEFKNGNYNIALCKTELNGWIGGCLSTDAKFYVTSGSANQNSPNMSDGIITWFDTSSGNSDIFISRYASADASAEQITFDPGNQYEPDIDGNRIIFQNQSDGNRIYVSLLDQQSDQMPRAPENLRTTGVTFHSVSVAWDDRSINEDSFVLVRTVLPGLPSFATWELPAGTTSFVDDAVQPETEYTYYVYAINFVGSSSPSNELTIVTPPDDPPTAVIVSPQNGSVLYYTPFPYFKVNVADDLGLRNAEVWLDGVRKAEISFDAGSTTAAVNYRRPWPLAAGTHVYEIRLWDVSGHPLSVPHNTQFTLVMSTGGGGAHHPVQNHIGGNDADLRV